MGNLSGYRSSPGFTLLEVLAALALLGIGLSILYAGYLQASYLEARAAEAGTAIGLARSKLAQAEAGGEAGVQGDCDGAPGFKWTLTRDSMGDTGLARLTATVIWGQQGERTVKVWALTNDEL